MDDKGYVRYIAEEGSWYITTYDEIGDEYVVTWDSNHWKLAYLIGNKSAREDHIVFEGTLAECNNYVADQFNE